MFHQRRGVVGRVEQSEPSSEVVPAAFFRGAKGDISFRAGSGRDWTLDGLLAEASVRLPGRRGDEDRAAVGEEDILAEGKWVETLMGRDKRGKRRRGQRSGDPERRIADSRPIGRRRPKRERRGDPIGRGRLASVEQAGQEIGPSLADLDHMGSQFAEIVLACGQAPRYGSAEWRERPPALRRGSPRPPPSGRSNSRRQRR